jgi:hypothetical protein
LNESGGNNFSKKYMENKERSVEEAEVKVIEEITMESSLQQSSGANEKKRVFKYFNIRIISLFVLGVLLGFAIKSKTVETLVAGANDPKLEKTRGDYLLSTMGKREVAEEVESEGVTETEEIELGAEEETGEKLETETEVPMKEQIPAE